MAPTVVPIVPLSMRILEARKGSVRETPVLTKFNLRLKGRFRLFVILKAKRDDTEPEIFTMTGALYPRGIRVS